MIIKDNTFYNTIVGTGPAEAINTLRDELRQRFPGLFEESTEEACRHQKWFQSELGGLGNSCPSPVVASWRIETEPIRSFAQAPISLSWTRSLKDSAASRGMTIGFVGIDTQRAPHAVAIAWCSDTSEGMVGSLGGDRFYYFAIMKHLFYGDSFAVLMKELISTLAVGPVPYAHRRQWSDSHSPLRVMFRTEDPLRDGWSLSPDFGEGRHRTMIMRNGFLPPEGASFSRMVGWRDAEKLLRFASECGTCPYLDEDAQLMVSGYGLFSSGAIDDCLRVIHSPAHQDRLGQGSELTEEEARASVMHIYVGLLNGFISQSGQTAESYSFARDHLNEAIEWMIQAGLIPVVAAGSSAVH